MNNISNFASQADKLKGLANSNPISGIANTAKNAQDAAKKVQGQVDDLKKQATEKIDYLKKQSVGSAASTALYVLFLPILKKIIKGLFSAEKIKNKLIAAVINQLKKKGKVEIQGKKIIFTPIKDDPSYQVFADNFNNKVTSLQNTLTVIQEAIKALDKVITTINTALTALKVGIQAAKIIIQARLVKIAAELAAPTPGGVKPTAGVDLTTIIVQLDKIKELEKKVDDYQAIVSALAVIVTLFKTKLQAILDAINGLAIVINSNKNQINNPQLNNNLTDKLSTLQGNVGTNNITETYLNYYLTIERLANESYQAVATEQVSGMKIAQTAPTKFVKPDALFNELKQILNT
jgi:hypothetical protein